MQEDAPPDDNLKTKNIMYTTDYINLEMRAQRNGVDMDKFAEAVYDSDQEVLDKFNGELCENDEYEYVNQDGSDNAEANMLHAELLKAKLVELEAEAAEA